MGNPALAPSAHGLTEEDLANLPASIIWPGGDTHGARNAREAIAALRALYSGTLGYEFTHVQDEDERAWLHQSVESGAFRQPLTAEERRELLRRLTEVEAFERFLHTHLPGQKRFSIEGIDMLVPMLDELDPRRGGAAHARGADRHGAPWPAECAGPCARQALCAHLLRVPYAPIRSWSRSEGSAGINYGWTGDVKYHLGARSDACARATLAQVRADAGP